MAESVTNRTDRFAEFNRRFDLFEKRVTRMVIGAMVLYTVICAVITVAVFTVLR